MAAHHAHKEKAKASDKHHVAHHAGHHHIKAAMEHHKAAAKHHNTAAKHHEKAHHSLKQAHAAGSARAPKRSAAHHRGHHGMA